MKHNTHLLIFVVFIFFFLFLYSCEGDVDSLVEDEYGSLEDAAILFRMKWLDRSDGIEKNEDDERFGKKTMSAPIDIVDECAERGVEKVSVGVRDDTGILLKSAVFDCSAGKGTLTEVKPQSGCEVFAAGLDYSGAEKYHGRKADVTLYPGMNNIGTVRLNFIETIFKEDFEGYLIGEVPSDYVLAGNRNQGVDDNYAATGDQSYHQSGSHGACWRAIMRHELFHDDISRPESMRIKGYFRLDEGRVGCHSGSGGIGWRTVDSTSWSAGSGQGLIKFHPDGSVTSAGFQVGEFERYEWIQFEIEYHWDMDRAEVLHRVKINDSPAVSVTRDAVEFESDLTVLELASDDFTVYWDDLTIESLAVLDSN